MAKPKSESKREAILTNGREWVGWISEFYPRLLKAAEQRGVPLEDIYRLGTDEGCRSLSKMLRVLEDERKLRELAELRVKIAKLRVWKTVALGQKSLEEYREALSEMQCFISEPANDMLPLIKVAEKVATLDLMLIVPSTVGLPKGGRIRDVLYAARGFGLLDCPAEVALALRIAWRNQGYQESVWIGMRPFRDSQGDLGIFDLTTEPNPYQHCILAAPRGGAWLNDYDRIIVVKPRSMPMCW
jgi:hypothetical protein